MDSQGSEGQAVDAFWPHRMVCGRSDSKVISIATASHQTAALMDDGSVWMNGIVKDGRGETVYDFVEVAGGEMWGGEEVENVERADFLDGREGEGKIVDLSMGWKFGQAIVVRD